MSAQDVDLILMTEPIAWYLKDLKKVPKKNISVLTTFSCGGGSSMGYKLAGCDVMGCVEIDEKIIEVYKKNLNPKYSFRMALEDFNKLSLIDLPKEFQNLDILDGSPPCSVFSLSGQREKNWGKEKFFREGQETQILDDLFFHFIKTARKLKPKVVIAENVKGLLVGNAKGYVKEIFNEFYKAGYDVQLFLFNSAKMNVPQARERTFFIAKRRDLNLPKLKFNFDNKNISFNDAIKGINEKQERKEIRSKLKPIWRATPAGKALSYAHPKGHYFNTCKINPNLPVPTVTAGKYTHTLPDMPFYLSEKELIRVQTFPDDYDFLNQDCQYITGMSVPPYMIKTLISSIVGQWNL